ncbi:MAG: class I SAM-dependent methyltransferase [Thermodesulfovibrionales bacterium]
MDELISDLGYLPDSAWAWHNFKRSVEALIVRYHCRDVLEVGGGRSPLFTEEDVARLGIRYSINDIDPEELSRGPAYVATTCFDIAGENIPSHKRFDLVFSRMVFEHLPDARIAYRNILELLTDGGVTIAFYPTLYSPPFVINKLMPERASSAVIRFFFPYRNNDQVPKIPAYYSWCFGDTERMSGMLKGLGYRDVLILPFYGHTYFQGLPVVRAADRWLSDAALRHDCRMLSSYAYSIARK